jgi:hypothetical protein
LLNARCFRCGWSFTLSREMIAAALTSAAGTGDRYHVEHCPRCRQVIKIPMDQLKRAVPPGWKPPEPQAASPATFPTPAPPASEPTPAPAAPVAQTEAAPQPGPAAPAEMVNAPKPARKRSAGKSAAAKGAAKAPVAKKTSPAKPAAKKPAASKKTK